MFGVNFNLPTCLRNGVLAILIFIEGFWMFQRDFVNPVGESEIMVDTCEFLII